MIKETVLTHLELRNYASEIDMSAKLKTNYAYIRQALDELLAENKIACVGEHYNEQFGKLFKYYTCDTSNIEKYTNSIKNRQYNSQRKMLATRVIDAYREHYGIVSVEAEYKMIQQNKSKIDLKFHQLGKSDFIHVYNTCVTMHYNNSYPTIDTLTT